MSSQLLVKRALQKAVERAPDTEVVCRDPDGDVRYTYEEFFDRVRRTANLLDRLGVEPGDTVSTYAPNSSRHLEVSFAVPMVGAAIETTSLGFPEENIASIHEREQKAVVFTETAQLDVLENVRESTGIDQYVLFDAADEDEIPETELAEVRSYESMMAEASADYEFPDVDEASAAMVSNSAGTTGAPKIFSFDQRGIMSYGLDIAGRDSCAIGPDDTMLVHPPLWYHNAWTYQYAAALMGAGIVLPRSATEEMPSGEQFCELVDQENVTFAYSISTLVPNCVEGWRQNDWDYDLRSLDRLALAGISLTQTPEPVLEEFVERTGARLLPASGFSEALAWYAVGPPPASNDWEDQKEFVYTGGTVNSLVDVKLVDPNTREEIPRDGETIGDIGLKGPYVIDGYRNPEKTAEKTDDEGYLFPGDIGVIDRHGTITPRERVEDMISGEEGLISPYELSRIARELPWVTEVATIAMPVDDHELPLVCVVLTEEDRDRITAADVREAFEGTVPDWQLPAVEIIDEIPTGNRGRRDVRALRERFQDKY